MKSYRANNNFIGRDREKEIFLQWIDNFVKYGTLYFYDALEDTSKKGGIGKTRLLNKCRMIARQRKHITLVVDFFNVADRDGVVIAERLVKKLHQKYRDWKAVSFKKLLRMYYTAVRTGTVDHGMRERLGQALATDLQTLNERMSRSNTYIIIFFDTFELIEQNPIIAVLQPTQHFPETYSFDRIRTVLAGRNTLDWSRPNWLEGEKEVLSVSLSPFSYEETLQYLRETSDVFRLKQQSSEVLQRLYQRTEGRPILIGLVSDVLNNQLKKLDELIAIPPAAFEASLVDQINYFDYPMKWAILFMAHIYHRFNAELLEIIMREPELQAVVPPIAYQELLVKLPLLSFVRRPGSGDDFVLHDEMRRLVIMHCWEKQDPDKRIRRQLSGLAITYYEANLAQATDEHIRQSYLVEMLFHTFFINVDTGFSLFREQFDRALFLSLRAFASSLMREASKFVEHMSSDQLYRIQLSKANLLAEEENHAGALQLYQEIEKEWIPSKHIQAEILSRKGGCYEHLSKFSEAITCLKEALAIEEWQEDPLQYCTTLSYLAYTYHLKGDFTEAANYYKANIELLQELNYPELYTHNLDNFGALRWRQGNLNEALHLSQQALQIRRDLFKQGKGSELFVCWSLGVLGRIYIDQKKLIEAENCFRENLDLGNHIGDKREIARSYIGLGLILTEQGDLKTAFQYFEQAYRVTVHVEEKIESLQGQGSIFKLKKQWEKAAIYFEQASKLAQEFSKAYYEAACLIELATSLEKQAKPTTQVLQQAEQIAQVYNYINLLGRIQELHGDIQLAGRDYLAAFDYYRIACHYLALYNRIQYEYFLSKLKLILSATPKEFVPEAINLLLQYWHSLDLQEMYPELPRMCNTVGRQ